ncbi:hypothetical protein ED733_008298 [Metarhizium rileyi]|uniref:Uncharacterized protein n=1 Tax=Metarhizium rileyi (strain RCEF 4871) TaxID=1649241 RepID=A0A5C6GGH3_METRR|nr:hypothetical protein ED733_008298 [Metarhizium rileyi]
MEINPKDAYGLATVPIEKANHFRVYFTAVWPDPSEDQWKFGGLGFIIGRVRVSNALQGYNVSDNARGIIKRLYQTSSGVTTAGNLHSRRQSRYVFFYSERLAANDASFPKGGRI